ncbi:MAG TPA: hypothetical protein PKC43_11785 [Phycisphaerales bacterium]|nr:hypothetical protein [Phycisphaerales bacterium]HMP38112.1 hypothetical protein [Phycisphaerales bacterium]
MTADAYDRDRDAALSSSDRAASGRSSTVAIIGTLLARVIVPLWVLAGAGFKLAERNPNLLPPPVRDTAFWIANAIGVADRGIFIEQTLRFLIATEFLLVAIMFFVPRLARLAAIFTLTMFVLVLTGVILSGAAACGCFGASGPPPKVVLAIDAAMLLGVLIFPARAFAVPRGGASALLAAIGAALGAALAYGIPNRPLPPQPAWEEQHDDWTSGGTGGVARSGGASSSAAPAAGPPPWPAPPALVSTYAPNFATWIGTPLRSHDLALIASRPLPKLDSGGWVVVYYRGDCEHCHDLIETNLAGAIAERTLLIRVPENDPALDHPLPNEPFQRAVLPDGPFYVFQTPVMLAVAEGTVRALVTDPADAPGIEAALAIVGEAQRAAAASAEAAPVTDAAAAAAAPTDAPRGAAERDTAPPAARPAPSAWPPPPALVSTYAPDFRRLLGKPLRELDLALQISRPLPRTIEEEPWLVVFYRGDCEHCHELIEVFIAPDHAARTILVRVPENDPARDLPLPDAPFRMHRLPDGPFYVLQTPVLLGVRDGIVRGLATDPDDADAVFAAIEAALAPSADGG